MRALIRRLAYLFRRDLREAELREEMAFHRSLAGDRAFGNATLAREDARAVWTAVSLERLAQDVRYGARALWKSRSFAAAGMLTLAMGIGASAVMFSVVNGVLLRPLPYADAHRIVMVWAADPARGLHEAGTSFPTFSDWRAQARSFADLAIWRPMPVNLTGTESPERVSGALTSPNTFPLLGVAPILGRTFSAADEERRDRVAVLSYRLWQRRFGGTVDAIGKSLELDGRPFEIVGVMPDGFYFPAKDVQLWIPSRLYGLTLPKFILAERTWTNRYNDLWRVVGRLKPGVAVRDAQAEMSAIGRRLATAHPSPSADFVGFDVEIVPMLTQITGRTLQLALWVLMGAVAFVLLIACANVANLLLARGVARRREFSVRAALGAGRARLLRQLAIENVLLGLAAGAVGLAVAAGGVRVLRAYASIPRLEDVTLDLRVVMFAGIVSLLSSVLFGTGPAWRLTSGVAADSLKQSGAATSGTAARRTRRLLVGAECALAVMLLAGAGLLLRSLSLVRSVSPGFDVARVLLVRVNLPLPVSPQWRKQEWATFLEMESRIAQIPGVTRVGMIQNLIDTANPEEAIAIEGAPAAAGDTLVGVTDTTPGYFEAMGIPLIRGRFFTTQEQNAFVAIVNASFAARFLPGQDPIGRRFKEGGPNADGPWHTIVGVVGDVPRQGLEQVPRPEYFFCSSEPTMDVVIRAAGNPAALAPAVRAAIHAVYSSAVVLQTATAEDTLNGLIAQRRFQTWLLSLFAAIALALAAIGTYGVVHFAVAQRTQEIGIRMALGARGSDIFRLVGRQGLTVPIAGTAAGLIGASALTRVMRHMLFHVEPIDWLIFGSVAVLLVAVAALACWFPARRAMRVDPLVALRHE
jgi:putative ABC transport system permease protein